MVMHLVPLAALHLSRGGPTPRIIASLIWPYLIKLCLSLRVSPQDIITSSRFLIFQLSQILYHDNQHHGSSDDDRTVDNNSRWCRALRLVQERVAQVRAGGRTSPDEEASLHILSMLAL